jgi:curved DNA-binding protein CbpA
MAKADPARNYYADLKVAPNASENEIRKAFRGLALQYHPDRNPGRETEFVVRFQEIQAAHEILCDQAQRTKYDAERRKQRNLNVPTNTPNTPRTRPPPPPRNAYTTTNPSGFHHRPPPTRPPPQQQRPPPPQQHPSYASGADRFTNNNFRPPPTAQRPDARAKDAEARANVFTAWQKMKTPRAEEPRTYSAGSQANQKQNGHSTPNTHSQQSQQSNPNGSPFGRSQSTRVPSSKKGFDPGTPGGDEGQARSAYRNYARPAPTPPGSTTPPHAQPPMQDSLGNDVPYSEGTRTRTPYHSATGGERTSMFEGLGRSSSVRNSPSTSHQPSPSADGASFSDSGRRQQRSSYGGKPTNPIPHLYPDSSDDDSEEERLRTRNSRHVPPPPKNPQPPPPPTWDQRAFGTPQSKQNGATEHTPNNFKSRSEESINIKFSPSDWHGKFEGNADYFTPNIPKGASARGRTSPTRGRPPQRTATERGPPMNSAMPPPVSPFSQSQTQYPSYPIPPPPPGPPPNVNFPPSVEPGAPAAKFKPEEWAGHFKEPSWVFSSQKETSPRRASEATKRPKGTRKASAPQDKRPKAQGIPEESPPKKYQATADDATAGDADAMDIDSSTPPVQNNVPSMNGSRRASAPPHALNGFANPTHPPAPGLNGVTAALVDDATFAAPATSMGLNGFGDALPFPSESSKTHPTKPNSAQKLKFPNLPKPPALPTTYDQVFVDLYFSRFETYCKDYMKATKEMTAHFLGRDAELASNLDDRFAHHRGETSKKLGFTSYMARMKEDEQVLQTWQVYQQKHLTAMEQCEEVRNRTMKLYQSPVV